MNSLIDEKKNLIIKKNKNITIINSINRELGLLKLKIYKQCKNDNNGHVWITERYSGPYGEKFTYCKSCRYEP